MSFKPYTEKIKKKKLEFVGSGSRTGPGSGSIIPEADPDPHQNDTDPKQ